MPELSTLAPKKPMSFFMEVLFGCGHSKQSFPLTPRGASNAYVVCLDCGREFKYDWKLMKIVKS